MLSFNRRTSRGSSFSPIESEPILVAKKILGPSEMRYDDSALPVLFIIANDEVALFAPKIEGSCEEPLELPNFYFTFLEMLC